MGLMGLGGTPWKDPDPARRRAAVAALEDGQQTQLLEVATEDPEVDIRRLAIARLTDVEALLRLARDPEVAVAAAAAERLPALADETLRAGAVSLELVAYAVDAALLVELSLREGAPGLRRAAVERLVALPGVSPSQLATVAIRDAVGDAGLVAVEALDRHGALKDVQRKAKAETVRTRAQEKIDAIQESRGGPSRVERRRACIDGLEACAAVLEPLAEADAPDAVVAGEQRQRGEALMVEYADLVEEAAVQRAAERFLRARDHSLARLAAVAAAAAAAPDPTPDPASDSASDPAGEAPAGTSPVPPVPEPPPLPPELATKAEAIIADATALVEGVPGRAAEDRFRELHKGLFALALPVGDRTGDRFKALYAAFKQKRKAHRQEVRAAQKEQVTVFEALADEAEQLRDRAAADGIKGQALVKAAKDLDRRWRTGPKLPASMLGKVKARFGKARDAVAEKVREAFEADTWERFARIPKAEALVEEAKALAVGEDPAATFRTLKDLQQRWKKVGSLPPERYPALWEAFKAEGDRVYAELKPWFASQDEERAANAGRKAAILDELEAHLAKLPEDGALDRRDLHRAQSLLDRWRGVGPVPKADNGPLLERFRELRRAVDRRRRKVQKTVQREQRGNLEKKQEILAQLEQLADTVGLWQQGKLPGKQEEKWLRQLRDLQRAWKDLGHVPRDAQDIVGRYREVCDGIYAAFEDYLAKQRAEEAENLKQKEEILAEFADYMEEEHPRWFKEQIFELKNQWRQIGQVPRRDYRRLNDRWQELWKQFKRL